VRIPKRWQGAGHRRASLLRGIFGEPSVVEDCKRDPIELGPNDCNEAFEPILSGLSALDEVRVQS
jgi:hypothetical protein